MDDLMNSGEQSMEEDFLCNPHAPVCPFVPFDFLKAASQWTVVVHGGDHWFHQSRATFCL